MSEKLKGLNFFPYSHAGWLTLAPAGRGSGGTPPARGAQRTTGRRGAGTHCSLCGEACIKKITHSRAWPTHQMKCKMMFILESGAKFLSVWSNLTLSAYGIERVLFLNPHPCPFSTFMRNDLFSKSVFPAVFPPTDSQREQKAQKQLGCVLMTCLSIPVTRNYRLAHTDDCTIVLMCAEHHFPKML